MFADGCCERPLESGVSGSEGADAAGGGAGAVVAWGCNLLMFAVFYVAVVSAICRCLLLLSM